jgi:glycosyltransferase involved in cell wall biosynthesis
MKFTIGIPAYKSIFLRECIESIFAQTCQDFELIVVDDDSPNDIKSVVDSFGSDRIQYYRNDKNFGAIDVVDNWNKCLSYAKGEFFVLMGDDDKMLPNYLSEFSALIERFPRCNVYHGRTVVINEQSDPVALSEPRPEFESVYDSILERMKGNRLFFISDYVFRTQALRKKGGFYKMPLAWASDDISSYIAAEENGIAHTNTPVFMYRRNSHTISSTGNVGLKMEAILCEERWLVNFVQTMPQNFTDSLLTANIRQEIRMFIQKKKIRTIYSSQGNAASLFFKWLGVRKKYRLSIDELLYASLLNIKERRKLKYS